MKYKSSKSKQQYNNPQTFKLYVQSPSVIETQPPPISVHETREVRMALVLCLVILGLDVMRLIGMRLANNECHLLIVAFFGIWVSYIV